METRCTSLAQHEFGMCPPNYARRSRKFEGPLLMHWRCLVHMLCVRACACTYKEVYAYSKHTRYLISSNTLQPQNPFQVFIASIEVPRCTCVTLTRSGQRIERGYWDPFQGAVLPATRSLRASCGSYFGAEALVAR